MGAAPNVRLKVPNRAENVLLVRQALTGLAEAIGLDAVALNDVSTAVTEAANNVVLHAYDGDEGLLEVEFLRVDDGLDVLVSDQGSGIVAAVAAGETVSDGIGIPVILALSDSVEFRDRPTGGTQVAMHFDLDLTGALEGDARLTVPGSQTGPQDVRPDEISLAVAPTEVGRSVVPRVLSTLAARAYFTTDRISDAQLLADTLVSELNGSNDGRLEVSVTVAPRNLLLRIGPLPSGRSNELFAEAPEGPLGSVIDRLTDGHTVSATGSLELLDLQISQRD